MSLVVSPEPLTLRWEARQCLWWCQDSTGREEGVGIWRIHVPWTITGYWHHEPDKGRPYGWIHAFGVVDWEARALMWPASTLDYAHGSPAAYPLYASKPDLPLSVALYPDTRPAVIQVLGASVDPDPTFPWAPIGRYAHQVHGTVYAETATEQLEHERRGWLRAAAALTSPLGRAALTLRSA